MPITFKMSFASHKRASQWSERNIVKPEEVPLYHQTSKYWFKCDKCPHEFETLPYTIAKINTWCSYCSNKKLCDNIDCSICLNKSFASSDKAQYLSSKNTINPRSVFKSCNKKLIFECNNCNNEFTATLNNISGGKWCKSCGFVSSKEKQSMKIEEFLVKAKEVNGDKYDYSKVVINNCNTPIIIICKIHGEFNQRPGNHITGGLNGCPNCASIRRGDYHRYTLDEFISKANKVHNNKYDYSRVKYINSQTPIIIICKEHSEFSQVPSSHLQGCGCKKCGEISAHDIQRLTIQQFIVRAIEVHGTKYNYSKSIWINAHTDIIIICKIHGEFQQNPYNHLKGHGCKRCTNIYCLEDFVSEAKIVHGDLYDYSQCIYEKSIKPVKIICKKCGIFEQTPNSHIEGAGCSICVNKTESKLYKWLKSIHPNIVKEYKADWCINPISGRCLRYDFMIPDNMTIIELDGGQHFKQVRNWDNPLDTMKRDIFKMQKAKSKGYKIIRLLQQDVYKNNNEWLNENLLSEINNPDRTDMFISSIDNIYEEHIKLIESGVIIILDSSESSEDDNI
jgi:hypothetical protein